MYEKELRKKLQYYKDKEIKNNDFSHLADITAIMTVLEVQKKLDKVNESIFEEYSLKEMLGTIENQKAAQKPTLSEKITALKQIYVQKCRNKQATSYELRNYYGLVFLQNLLDSKFILDEEVSFSDIGISYDGKDYHLYELIVDNDVKSIIFGNGVRR